MKAIVMAMILVLLTISLCFAGELATNSGPALQNAEDKKGDEDMNQLMKHFVEQDSKQDVKVEAHQPGLQGDAQPVRKIEFSQGYAKKTEPLISVTLKKGSTFGDALRTIALKRPFYYSIMSTPAASAGMSSAPQMQQSPLSPRPPQSGSQQASADQGIYDIPVNFSYAGDSVDEAVGLLCKGADVYCTKNGNVWEIARHEVYIVDKDVFFTYSVGNGGSVGSSGGTASTGTSGTSGTTTGSSTVSGTSATGAAGSVSGSSAGSDTIGISGNFDDFTTFIKSFLSKDGQVQISKNGYLVVDDVPSAIAKIRKILAKDKEMAGVRVKVDVISVTLQDDYSGGVDWNAVMKNVAVTGSFAPANAFNIGYNTTKGGNPVTALLGVLGTYGNSRVVKSLDTTALNGVPIFFNVTESIPYFQQTSALSSGVSQTSTTINYVNVGLKVKILPNVREATLNGGIYTELSALISMNSSGGSSGSTAPDISLSNTAVPLEIPWGNTVILTGYKTKTVSTASTGIPLLAKIPLLGALFGSQSKNGDSQELCIVITATKDGTGGHSDDQHK